MGKKTKNKSKAKLSFLDIYYKKNHHIHFMVHGHPSWFTFSSHLVRSPKTFKNASNMDNFTVPDVNKPLSNISLRQLLLLPMSPLRLGYEMKTKWFTNPNWLKWFYPLNELILLKYFDLSLSKLIAPPMPNLKCDHIHLFILVKVLHHFVKQKHTRV